MNIVDSIFERGAERGDHIAIEDRDEEVTYRELLARVRGAAANLRDAGIDAGDFVGVMLPDSPDHVVALLALAGLGAISVSMVPSLPPAEVQHYLGRGGLRTMITETGAAPIETLKALALGTVCAPRPETRSSDWAPVARFDEDQPLMLMQSSGTTGPPKYLLLSHAQIAATIRRHVGAMGLTSDDRYLQDPSLAHLAGRRRCLAMLDIGGTVVLNHTKYFADVAVLFGERRITYNYATPARLRAILEAIEKNGLCKDGPLCPDLRLVVSGSMLCHDQFLLARHTLTPHIFESYGSTEVGDLTMAAPEDHDEYPDSVGRLIEGIEARVVDEEGRLLPHGQVGAIGFRCPDFPSAYYQNEEATGQAFRNGWFYPGDLAAINGEGYVFLKGRADDVINYAGDKFYPAEVESVLLRHPSVAEAAVVGRHKEDNVQVAVAFIVASQHITLQDLVDHCKAHLAAHKVPLHIEEVAQLPRSPQGKVLKRNLKKDFQRKYKLTRSGARWAGDAQA